GKSRPQGQQGGVMKEQMKLTRRHLLELAGATGALLASGAPAFAATTVRPQIVATFDPLAGLIDKLTHQPHQPPLANRKDFNKKPQDLLKSENVTGADLKAFMSLNRRDIIARVMRSATYESDPTKIGEPIEAKQQEFARWAYDFYRFVWDESEEGEYPK